jgi:hypothetical protein
MIAATRGRMAIRTHRVRRTMLAPRLPWRRRRNPMAKLKTPAAEQSKQVTAIVKELRKAGVSDPRTKLIERRVNQLIEILRELKPHGPQKGNRKSNRDYAKKLISSIDQCEQLLAGSPDSFPVNFLFVPPPTSLFVADPVAVEDRAEAVYLEAERRRFDFVVFLREMREKCERIIEHRLGEHGRSGRNAPRWQAASCWNRSEFHCTPPLQRVPIARSLAYSSKQ